MRTLVGIASLGLVGCVAVERDFFDQASSIGVDFVRINTDNGRIAYDGSATDGQFRVSGTSYGTGGGQTKATSREAANRYNVEVRDGALVANATSRFNRAGVHFDITGPALIDTELISSDSVRLDNVEGFHVISGSSVFARNVIGDADFFSTGGMDVQLLPYTDVSVINLTASGDLLLGLPWGLDYDLNVFGDPDHPVVIDDLGFDTFAVTGATGLAWRGFRSIRVNVDVTGGGIDIYPL